MDYVRRMIEQIAQMLAAIVGHRNAGRTAEAKAELERVCLRTAGLPLSLVKQASPEALRDFLQTGGLQRQSRDILLAELLLQDAEINADEGRADENLRSLEHAFCLISEAMPLLSVDDGEVYRPKLDRIGQELKTRSLDPYVLRRLAE